MQPLQYDSRLSAAHRQYYYVSSRSSEEPCCSHYTSFSSTTWQTCLYLCTWQQKMTTIMQPFHCDLQPRIPKHPITQPRPKQLETPERPSSPAAATLHGKTRGFVLLIFSCIFVFGAVNEKSNKKEEVQTRIANIFRAFLPWTLPQHNKRGFTINNLEVEWTNTNLRLQLSRDKDMRHSAQHQLWDVATLFLPLADEFFKYLFFCVLIEAICLKTETDLLMAEPATIQQIRHRPWLKQPQLEYQADFSFGKVICGPSFAICNIYATWAANEIPTRCISTCGASETAFRAAKFQLSVFGLSADLFQLAWFKGP